MYKRLFNINMPSLQLIKITAETSKNSKFNFLANS